MEPLTPDDVLERIGGFGRYQFLLLLVMGFMKIFGDGFQAMVATFLAAEPPWRCVSNSSSCNVTGSISPGHLDYRLRCNLARDQWEFDTSEFNSIVTEVSILLHEIRSNYTISELHVGTLSPSQSESVHSTLCHKSLMTT